MDTVSLSHTRAVTVLPDPIHDMISVTCFERELIDSDYFQRLHFILQNSTTYVAFPSNKNSRFSHSLGVSHLCGKLLVNSVRNASPQDLSAFLENAAVLVINVSLKSRVGGKEHDLRVAWRNTISGHSNFRHRPSLRVGKSSAPVESLGLDERYPKNQQSGLAPGRTFTAGMLIDTLWQAIRICGLAHDIGHLPMSHSLEGAAKKFRSRLKHVISGTDLNISDSDLDNMYSEITCSDNYAAVIDEFENILRLAYPDNKDFNSIKGSFDRFPLHEKRSLFILYLLFENGMYAFESSNQEYRTLIYHLSFLILFSSIQSAKSFGKIEDIEKKIVVDEPENVALLDNSAFRFLKLIIAGSIDGDRMDYTLRDGHACGSHIGSFDVSGIIEHATLFRRKETNDFKLGFFHRALPAIEQFFSERHQSYKYLIYHRTSSRTEACLQHLILEILELCFIDPTDSVAQYFTSLGYFFPESNGRHRIFPIFLQGNKNHALGGGVDHRMPFLDDSNLRSFFQWSLSNIQDRDLSGQASKLSGQARKIRKLQNIEVLLRVVLKRQFQHIYDPYKSGGLRAIIRSSIDEACEAFGLTSELADDVSSRTQALFATNRVHRSEALKLLRSLVMPNLPSEVQFITNEQEPKIYDHEISMAKGEEINIVYNDVDKDGYVKTKAANEVSTYLSRSDQIYIDEFRISYYFVSCDIKRNEELVSRIDEIMYESVRAVIKKTVDHLLSETGDSEQNV